MARRESPANPHVFRVREDLEWEDVIFNHFNEKKPLAGILFYYSSSPFHSFFVFPILFLLFLLPSFFFFPFPFFCFSFHIVFIIFIHFCLKRASPTVRIHLTTNKALDNEEHEIIFRKFREESKPWSSPSWDLVQFTLPIHFPSQSIAFYSFFHFFFIYYYCSFFIIVKLLFIYCWFY